MLSTALGDEGGGYCTVLEEHMLEASGKSRAGSNAPDPFWHAIAGTKMAVASEVEKPINAAAMKKLAEPLGVPQATRDLYGGATQWRPMCTFWVAANRPPNGGQDEEAFARRLDLIPLRAEFLSPDQMPAEPSAHQHVARRDMKLRANEARHELLWWASELFPTIKNCPYDTLGPRPEVVQRAIRDWLAPAVPQPAAPEGEDPQELPNPVDVWVRRWVGFVPPAISLSRKEMIDLIVKATKMQYADVRLRLTELGFAEKDTARKRVYEMHNSFGAMQAVGKRAVPNDDVM